MTETTTPPSIPYLVHRIAVRIEDSVNANTKQYGLRINETRVLMRLLDEGDSRVGELAELTSIAPSALSHLLKRMARAGWVTRERVPDDNRSVLVKLTNKGRHLAILLHPYVRNYNDLTLRGFDPAEVDLLRDFLQRIFENIRRMDEVLPKFPDAANLSESTQMTL